MIETPWYIDELQNTLLSTDTADPDFISDAAAEYAEACAAVNERLRKIAPLLRRGLRSEVIQLTEIEPNLLELVATLDFPEREDWCQLLKIWNREPPPPLLLDLASQINETYAMEAPLQTLLKRHRVLPLAGAPLADRIEVLRKLAQADPDTVVWQQDVEILEEARTKEIRKDLEDAFKQNDFPRLLKLVEELDSSEWTNPPAPRVVSLAKELKQRLTEQSNLKEIKEVIQQLTSAYGEFDVAAGRELRSRYEDLLKKLGVPLPAEFAELAQESLDWLIRQDAEAEENLVEATVAKIPDALAADPAEALKLCQEAHDQMSHFLHLGESVRQDVESRIQPLQQEAQEQVEKKARFDTVCQQLTNALRKQARPDELKPFHTAIVSFQGETFPPELQQKYSKYVKEWNKKEGDEKRWKLIIRSAIAGSVLIAVTFIVLEKRNKQQAELAVEDLKTKIAAGQLVEARKLIKSLPSRTQLHPLVLDQKGSLDKAEQDERIRKKNFVDQLQLFQNSDPAKPNREAEAEAKKLAATTAEKKRLTAAQQKMAQLIEVWRGERQAVLEGKLDNAKAELNRLADLTGQPTDGFEQELKEVTEGLKDIASLEKKKFPELATRAQQMITEAEQLKQLADLNRAKTKMALQASQLQAAITVAIGDVAAYQAALKAFVDETADSPSKADYSATIKNTQLWKQVAGVSPWQIHYRNLPSGERSVAQEVEFQKAYQALVTANGPPPFEVDKMARQRYRAALTARSQPATTSELKKFLNNPKLSSLWMVRAKNGRRYYHDQELVRGDLPRVGDKLVVYYRATSVYKSTEKAQAVQIKEDDIVFFGIAPHSKLSKQFLEGLSGLNAENWEAVFFGMITGLLAEEDMDPVLKLKLLDLLVTAAAKGSYPFEQGFAKFVTALQAVKVTVQNVDWFKVDDADVLVARDRASGLIKTSIDLAAVTARGKETKDRLTAAIDTNYEWIARLSRDSKGELAILWKAGAPTNAGQLCILETPGSAKKGGFQVIGRVSVGQLTPASLPLNITAGIHIYFHPDADSSTSDSTTP